MNGPIQFETLNEWSTRAELCAFIDQEFLQVSKQVGGVKSRRLEDIYKDIQTEWNKKKETETKGVEVHALPVCHQLQSEIAQLRAKIQQMRQQTQILEEENEQLAALVKARQSQANNHKLVLMSGKENQQSAKRQSNNDTNPADRQLYNNKNNNDNNNNDNNNHYNPINKLQNLSLTHNTKPLRNLNNHGNPSYVSCALQLLNACRTPLHNDKYQGKWNLEWDLHQLFLEQTTVGEELVCDHLRRKVGYEKFRIGVQEDIGTFMEKLLGNLQDTEVSSHFAIVGPKKNSCCNDCPEQNQISEKKGTSYVRFLLPNEQGNTLQEQINSHLGYQTNCGASHIQKLSFAKLPKYLFLKVEHSYPNPDFFWKPVEFSHSKYKVVGCSFVSQSCRIAMHYTCIVLHSEKWYYCDRSDVSVLTDQEVVEKFKNFTVGFFALQKLEDTGH